MAEAGPETKSGDAVLARRTDAAFQSITQAESRALPWLLDAPDRRGEVSAAATERIRVPEALRDRLQLDRLQRGEGGTG